jgi:Tfp pilus assembly protein PilX
MGPGDSGHAGRSANRRYRGAALVLVIGIMFLLMALGTGTLYWGLQNRLLAIHDGETILAKAAADAGLRKAVAAMSGYESGDLPAATGEALPGSPASYSYIVTRDLDGGYSASATGTCGTAVRTVACKLSSSTLWSSVMLGVSASLDAHSRIRPLVSGGPLRLRTNSTAAGQVQLISNSVIEGDVMIGPGGDPGEVIALKSGGEITGDRLVAGEVVDFPPVVPPSVLPDRGSVQITSPQVISTDGQYSSLTIKGPQVEIQGDVTLYVTGEVTIRSSALLLVRDGSRLTLYVGGTFTLEDHSTMKEVNLHPERLQIYGTPTCTAIDIKNSSTACAAIYGPAAQCSVDSSSDLVGVFSGRSLALKSSSSLAYDPAVEQYCLYRTSIYRIGRWWEN